MKAFYIHISQALKGLTGGLLTPIRRLAAPKGALKNPYPMPATPKWGKPLNSAFAILPKYTVSFFGSQAARRLYVSPAHFSAPGITGDISTP